LPLAAALHHKATAGNAELFELREQEQGPELENSAL
jgi:hypothetical protein